jgi:hypothetical protein
MVRFLVLTIAPEAGFLAYSAAKYLSNYASLEKRGQWMWPDHRASAMSRGVSRARASAED